MPRRIKRKFIAIPINRTTKWSCTIAGIDITDFILSGSFPHGLISEELICEIELDNSGEDFTEKFSARDIIQFKMDFADGSTVQFEGEVEEIKNKIESGFFKLGIKGAHFTAQTLDVLVTEEFTNSTISNIRTSLISTYLSDFTTANVESNTTVINIKFVNKPLLDCLLTLDLEGNEDTYIDFNKDFHTFKKGSKTNLNIHFTPDDSLITLRGLGTDSAEVRNKIQVYGEAGGLPVIATSEDSVSQSTFRIKESLIQDTNITNEAQASELADAERDNLKNPEFLGSLTSFFWTGVNPGDKAYVISNPHKVHDLFRIVKFSFKVPGETMEVFFNKERSIPKLFKDRIKKDLGQETIVNPNKMNFSFNFTFDNENKIDSVSSSAVELSESKLKLVSGNESGEMISITKNTTTVNSVRILAIGEVLDGANYYINAVGTNNWQQVTLDTLTDVTEPGTKLRLRIEINNTSTRIDAIVILHK